MSLHEYIDIPLEGSVSSDHPRFLVSSSGTSSPALLVAARLFKEWLEASAGARMNADENLARRTRKGIGRRGEKVGERKRKVGRERRKRDREGENRTTVDGTSVQPGIQTARVEFSIASGGTGGLTAST